MAGHERSRRRKPDDNQSRYLKFLAVPVIVIILAAVIVLTGRKEKIDVEVSTSGESTGPVVLAVETESGETETEVTEESSETEESTEAIMEFELEKDGVEAVTKLARDYFDAKQAADAETMYRLFGRSDTNGMEKLRESLQYSARYTEGYENVTAYTTPGPEQDSYLVYISYDLKFRGCDTLAPGLFWTFVKKNGEGEYCMTEMSGITQDILEFVNQVEQSEAAYQLRTKVYEGLRTALEADGQLAELYAILLESGSSEAEETEPVSHEINIGEVVETTPASQEGQSGEPAGENGEGLQEQTAGPANDITAGAVWQ